MTREAHTPAVGGAVQRLLRAVLIAVGVALLAVASSAATLIVALRYLRPAQLQELQALVSPARPIPVPSVRVAVRAPLPIPVPSMRVAVRNALPIPVPAIRVVSLDPERSLRLVPSAPSPAPDPLEVAPDDAVSIPLGVRVPDAGFVDVLELSAVWQAYRRELLAALNASAERDAALLALQRERERSAGLEERLVSAEARVAAAQAAPIPVPPPLDTTHAPPPLPNPSVPAASVAPPGVNAAAVPAALDVLRLSVADVPPSELRYAPDHTVTRDELLVLTLEGPVSRVEHVFDEYSRALEVSRLVIDAPGVEGLAGAAAAVLHEALGAPLQAAALTPGAVLRFEGRARTATLTIESATRVRVEVRPDGVAGGAVQVFRASEDDAPAGGMLFRAE